MKKIIVQIYEIQSPFEAEKLTEFGVDHIGSVIVSATEWKIPSIKETIQVIRNGNTYSSLIPLYSDPAAVLRTVDYYQPDIIHFCETLPLRVADFKSCQNLVELQKNVKQRFPEIKIMRAIPIAQAGMSDRVPSLELARVFEPVSDLFLTDTLILKDFDASGIDQPVDGFVGITGKTCDWDMAAKLIESSRIPVILAGGISPENVYNGILHTHAAGVDSCTGTNAVDSQGRPIRFKKDLNKVKRFIEEVRRAEKVIGER